MKVNCSSYAVFLKEIIVLMLVSFHYPVQFHIVKGFSHGSHKGDYTIDGQGPGIVHKHSIKTVRNAHGDQFDCVDIYKQPGLDHPLLKDHIVQMKPSSLPRGKVEEVASRTSFSKIRFLNEDCPMGTIPIMRPRKKKYSLPETSINTTMDVHEDDIKPLISYEAQLRMNIGSYYGAEADLNVYGLPQVSANQLSTSIVWLLNDGDGTAPAESVMAGWMVNPRLYGDNKTHLFLNWTVDGFHKTGCYSNYCPGFVQVNPGFPLGGILEPVSVYDGPQYAMRILIYKDPSDGHWWLLFDQEQEEVGYWPSSLFTALNDHASKVHWGGLAWCPINERSPPMGSGHFADAGLRRACYSASLSLVNGSNYYMRIAEDNIQFYNSGPGCYSVGHLMNMDSGTQGFLFGGPGNCAYMT